MIQELKPLIGKLSLFAKDRMGFKYPPKLFLKKDAENSQLALGRTAHYNPDEKSITLFVSNRHPKDILRSFAHELVHHTQNLRGDLNPEKMANMTKNYAQDNEHMRNMEKEAYLKGNMCFRDWEDSLDNKELFTIKLAESMHLKEKNKMTTKVTKKFLRETIRKILAEELNSVEEEQMTIGDMAKGVRSRIGSARGAAAAVKQGIRMGGPTGLKMALKAAIASKDGGLAAKAAEAAGNEPSLRDSELRMVALKLVRDKGTSRQNIDSHSAGGDMMQGLKNIFKEEEEEDLEEGSCASRDDDEDVQEEGKSQEEFAKNQPPYDKATAADRAGPDGKKKDKKKGEKKSNPPKSEENPSESKIQTPEQENTLYENRFAGKNERLYQKLIKEWAK